MKKEINELKKRDIAAQRELKDKELDQVIGGIGFIKRAPIVKR